MAEYKAVNVEQLDSDLKSVADSIRSKGGTSGSLTFPEGFKTAVANIKTGDGAKEEQDKDLEITENGNFTIFPDEGKVLSSATAKVNVPERYDEGFAEGKEEGYNEGYNKGFADNEPVLEVLTATENKEYTPSDNVDGFSSVTVNVPLKYDEGFQAGVDSVKLQEKTVIENGDVLPDTGFSGMSKVTVAVPTGSSKEEQEKSITITENGTTEVTPDEGKTLSKVTIETSVAGSGEVGKPYIDTSKITDFIYFCANNARNNIVNNIDTSNGTNFTYMFMNCDGLKEIPSINTSKGINFSRMFIACTRISTIPQLDTSNGINFSNMFEDCSLLTTIPQLDTSNGTKFANMFSGCSKLETVSLTAAKGDLSTDTFQNCTALTNLTIGEGWAASIYLTYSKNLSVESLHGMIGNFADLTGKTAKEFQVGATNLAKIDADHIAMLEAKNWSYS